MNYNIVPVVRRGGILKMDSLILRTIIADFFTGKRRIVNQGLKLRGIKRIYTDFNLSFDVYEFAFMGDDLPIIQEGCYPLEIVLDQVEFTTDCFRLVEA